MQREHIQALVYLILMAVREMIMRGNTASIDFARTAEKITQKVLEDVRVDPRSTDG